MAGATQLFLQIPHFFNIGTLIIDLFMLRFLKKTIQSDQDPVEVATVTAPFDGGNIGLF